MRPAVVLVIADGPSPTDPATGRRRYEGGYLPRVAMRYGAIPVLLSDEVADLTAKSAGHLVSRFDLVVVGEQSKTNAEKLIAEAARYGGGGAVYNAECLEAWLRDWRAK